MTGSGIGVSLGTGTLLGAGALGGSPFAFTCQFFGWLNGAPVVTTLNGDFSSWNKGAVFVDTGVRAPAPGPTGYCIGTAVLQGLKLMVGTGSGFCTGTGVLTGLIPPPVTGTWYLRRVSPVEPIAPVFSPTNLPAWDRRVSPKTSRQRQVTFS